MAAEYAGRTATGERSAYFVDDYVLIDVAVYPAKGRVVSLSRDHFTLSINGKDGLMAQAAGTVAMTVRNPQFDRRGKLDTTVGAGPVILGPPRRGPQFPGDPGETQGRLPAPPRVPEEDRSGIQREPAETDAAAVEEQAMPEGKVEQPVRGYLYFPYRGKLGKIKTLVLMYRSSEGKAELTIPTH
ncbi:MAG: hypothetical protein U0Q16_27975 [Bryobacteraceae bacterium]